MARLANEFAVAKLVEHPTRKIRRLGLESSQGIQIFLCPTLVTDESFFIINIIY